MSTVIVYTLCIAVISAAVLSLIDLIKQTNKHRK
jgi:hypothetical protein